MKKWTVRVLACAALVSGVLIVPTSAGAVTRTWSFQDVTGVATAVQRNGVAVTMSVNCPNGMTPVAGWTIPSVADDIRRNSETMGLGSGTGYTVKVDDETAGSETITITPHVRCVSMNNFTAGTTIKTPVQTFQVDDTSQWPRVRRPVPRVTRSSVARSLSAAPVAWRCSRRLRRSDPAGRRGAGTRTTSGP